MLNLTLKRNENVSILHQNIFGRRNKSVMGFKKQSEFELTFQGPDV